jgi:hypothetical protein
MYIEADAVTMIGGWKSGTQASRLSGHHRSQVSVSGSTSTSNAGAMFVRMSR